MKSRAFPAAVVRLAAVMMLLSGCGAPIGPPAAASQGEIQTTRASGIESDLYIVDHIPRAVVELDRRGSKITKRAFQWQPWDVVTDSHGNVYVLTSHRTSTSDWTWGVLEMTHDLKSRIALYSLNSRVSKELTIDGADNLYVDVWDPQTNKEFVAEYAYGSTSVEKTFALEGVSPGSVAGLALQRGTLLVVTRSISSSSKSAHLWACPLAGSGSCSSKAGVPVADACGFAMTDRLVVIGEGGIPYPYLKEYVPDKDWDLQYKGSIKLPTGLFLNYLFCDLHARGEYVWAGLRTYKHEARAVAAEFDMVHNTLHTTIGAGQLGVPVAVYSGNGLVQ